ncbi:Hypothetical protein R9X50_00069200 [Acrodontium crateriforme]|uniref:Uncharacterized protein n=1 Tax=Acrodontium crateriforme TaxID=150365 RepID=A0AAQ3LY01_9PEZI|nr:Hypothetical protein R9X50_00069200 [Acrodontium crateriforme]
MRPTQIRQGGGGKIPYPKHVWSPAGGWYSQPANWKTNTAIMGAAIVGICLMIGSVSAEREHRNKMPDPNRFFPSRWWSKQIVEHEKAQKASESS